VIELIRDESRTCGSCLYYVNRDGMCGCPLGENCGEEVQENVDCCPDWTGSAAETEKDLPAELIRREGAELSAGVRELGDCILRLGQLISGMQARMDELESRQAAVTIRHADALRLQAQIRQRAAQVCDKYALSDKESPKVIRNAIKRDVLKRYGIRDLHDLPEAQRSGAESLIAGWTSIRLVMERRGMA